MNGYIIMKNQAWLLSLLLLFTLALTGCGMAAEAEEESLQPIDAAAWPTAKPSALAASPTPFPQGSLAATATPTPVVVVTAAPAVTAEPSTGNVVAQVNSGLYAPVATAFVTADKATVYRQPGQTAVGAMEKGELVAVLGQNAGGDWLYILTTTQLQGWLPQTSLHLVGTLEQAPVLPPDPLAAAVQPTAAEAAANAAVTTAATPHAVPLTDLKAIATAQVKSDGLNMRQGPGAAYGHQDTLARNDQVSILAVNSRRDWALVETSAGQQGWVSLAYLTVQSDLSNAPVTGPTATQATASASTKSTATTTEPLVEPVSFKETNSSTTISSLGPIATAHLAQSEVYIRPGPSADYAGIEKLTDPQGQISILALDQSQNWALVQPASAKTGWVVLTDIATEANLANAPQIFTAWVVSNAVEIRSGPGIFHDQTGQLAINSLVRVLGLDDSGSWALIQPITGGSLGWAQIQFLKNVGQSWANVPEVKDDTASVGIQAEEPIVNRQLSIVNDQPHIVFQRSSGGDIMVINPDGSGLRRLTSGIDPALSTDGQTVAFTRWQGETGSLWLINLDGSNERQVLGFIKQAKGPDWSPDGTQIVLNYQHEGRLEPKTECFDISEGQRPRPPRNADNFKVKIDDGSPRLCWTLPPDPHWGLKVVNLADGSFKDVDGGTYAFRPAWDPVQSWRIVSDGGRGLLAADLNRDNRQKLTDEINDGSPVFSPDGRYIVVTTGKEGSGAGYDLYRLNADGSGRVQLTQTPLWVTVQPDEAKAWNNVAPAWSPDASQIAFLTDRTGRWEIWVMNADGSNQHPMFSDEVNDQLQLTYNFVDERVLSWR